jgi:endonuclease/exonuclease/phosphatase family metal-dependent hydrolase
MRVATFNIESLDVGAKAHVDLETRVTVLRPVLERLAADVLCLQEVNGQRTPGQKGRQLIALNRLLAGTRYQEYMRATASPGGAGIADVHNLVTLSRFPIVSRREVLHDFVPVLERMRLVQGRQGGELQDVRFDRPLLLTEIRVPGGLSLSVINAHLRAPLASPVSGQKSGPFAWRSVSGWAEGFLLSALKRDAQALELRLLLEEMLRGDTTKLIAVAGDFNAPDPSTALLIAVAPEDLGTSQLAANSLVVLDRAISAGRRWSILHHGRPQMVDHILASRALYGRFRHVEVHNEWLGDEALGYGKALHSAASYHAPVVAEFDFGREPGGDTLDGG